MQIQQRVWKNNLEYQSIVPFQNMKFSVPSNSTTPEGKSILRTAFECSILYGSLCDSDITSEYKVNRAKFRLSQIIHYQLWNVQIVFREVAGSKTPSWLQKVPLWFVHKRQNMIFIIKLFNSLAIFAPSQNTEGVCSNGLTRYVPSNCRHMKTYVGQPCCCYNATNSSEPLPGKVFIIFKLRTKE